MMRILDALYQDLPQASLVVGNLKRDLDIFGGHVGNNHRDR